MAESGNHAGRSMWPSLQTADWLFTASNILLIVGLSVTVVATIGAVWMANVREGYLKRELAESNERIAAAGEAAAKANEAAERERLARIKIEEKLSPRSLAPEQRLAIAAKLKPFAPQRFQFLSYQDDPEASGLVTAILVSLMGAGWEVKPASAFLAFDLTMGVVVELTTENAPRFMPAAEALATALNEERIAAEVSINAKITDPMDAIRIKVGRKP